MKRRSNGIGASAADAGCYACDDRVHGLPLCDRPKGFFPQQDTGRLIGAIQADQNTSFQFMSRQLTRFADTVSDDPAVADVIAFTAAGEPQIQAACLFR
jgi:multidrug efflux pump subunit AcrB